MFGPGVPSTTKQSMDDLNLRLDSDGHEFVAESSFVRGGQIVLLIII